jgi:Xaa-Pro aminopeptidase
MILTPMSEIAGRIVALQALLRQGDVEAAIIRQNADLYYFTGTVQDAHLIIPAAGQPLFLVRRDVERALSQSPIRPVASLKSMKELPPAVASVCGASPAKRLGMELDVLPANSYFLYQGMFPESRIVDVSRLIRQIRMIKSEWEIGMMRKAAELARVVADAVPVALREGITELELSAELEMAARKAGHLGLLRLRAFNMDMHFGHVLSGPEAAVPSYADAPTGGTGLSPAFGQGPGERRIGRSEVVSIDVMMNYNGYLNDQTRNYCIGEPLPEVVEAYRTVQEMHALLREMAKPGVLTEDVYNRMVRHAEESGWAKVFMGHGEARVSFIGHGVGVEVDEYPFISKGRGMPLQEGMVFAFEPKIIIPDVGIAGLENTYLTTRDGVRSLNTASEELTIL